MSLALDIENQNLKFWDIVKDLNNKCEDDDPNFFSRTNGLRTFPGHRYNIRSERHLRSSKNSFPYHEDNYKLPSTSTQSDDFAEQLFFERDQEEDVIVPISILRSKVRSKVKAIFRSFIQNIDGANDVVPDETTIRSAEKWLSELEKNVTLRKMNLDAPLINIGVENEIVFEWWCDNRKITLYISNNTIEYLKSWGASITDEMEDGEIHTFEDTISLWHWLKNG